MVTLPGCFQKGRTMRNRALASVFLLALSGLFAAARADDSVTVRLKWFNQAQFAGFYVAQDKGFYKSSGLDVNIQPGGPDFPAIQMVAGGNEQFGVTGADQILIARSKGVPVVALAVIYRRNPFVLFSLAKSGIKTPADYVGKKVGVKIGGNEELIYRAVLAKAGIDKSTLTEIPVKFDITPLLTGAIDVWPGYLINEVLAAKEKGFDVNVVYPSDYGIDLYADTLFTTEQMLKQKPDVVRRIRCRHAQGLERRHRGAGRRRQDHRRPRRQAHLRPRTGDDEGEHSAPQARRQGGRRHGRSRLADGAAAPDQRRLPETAGQCRGGVFANVDAMTAATVSGSAP